MSKDNLKLPSKIEPYGYLDIYFFDHLSGKTTEAYLQLKGTQKIDFMLDGNEIIKRIQSKGTKRREHKVDGKKIMTLLLPRYYGLVSYEDHLNRGRILFEIPNKNVYSEIENIVKQSKISKSNSKK